MFIFLKFKTYRVYFIRFYWHGDKYSYCVKEISYRTVQLQVGTNDWKENTACIFRMDMLKLSQVCLSSNE